MGDSAFFCRPLRGLNIYFALCTWGLRPRLYAFACFAGLILLPVFACFAGLILLPAFAGYLIAHFEITWSIGAHLPGQILPTRLILWSTMI